MLSRQSQRCYRVETQLTFATVAALRPLGLAALAATESEVTFELGSVSQADSAGLALLVDWLAAARARGTRLRFAGLSPTLRSLARLSDVEELLAPQDS
jgi:phospholipid transport system transporter-binding protein